MLTPAEAKVLKKISEMNLITKHELKKFLNDNGSGRDINAILESATKGLMEKNLVSTINPVGSTCFVITKKGSRMLQDME
ncbi:MAG: hypothetical protein HYT72_00160 [Candidatus Aenigmarchaeota archaeon]|nr:hypothetical protein [Candidatus Aenigmarchaeota archaeon]